MAETSVADLCVLSRALERVIRAVPNKPRADLCTQDLLDAVLAAAKLGMRDEVQLARAALEQVRLQFPQG
jgi:hypothetical protein